MLTKLKDETAKLKIETGRPNRLKRNQGEYASNIYNVYTGMWKWGMRCTLF